ncbi:MAG: hypothetical protein AAF915_04700 [Cyanobacteria bacterium P01_D01_bin.50]
MTDIKLSLSPNQKAKKTVTLALDSYTRSRHQISLCYWLDSIRFTTSYWYDTVDFYFLEEQYGKAAMEKVYFHILAFEAMKVACLQPDIFDLGNFSDYYTEDFDSLWHEIFRKSYSQWRYENNLPSYLGPTIVRKQDSSSVSSGKPITLLQGDTPVLVCSGGGKDSLVMYKLLERGGISFSSYSYAGTAYGKVAKQFSLIEHLLQHTSPVRVHRHYGFSDYVDTPIAELHPEYGTSKMPEMDFFCPPPTSIFCILPVALQHGYSQIIVGHERGADTGSLIWDKTGEEVSHAWCKSTQSDRLLGEYVKQELVCNVNYFSLLRPIYDTVIFSLLQRDSNALKDTHSCNLGKPWCERCAKCAYVYLCCMAYLPQEQVKSVFSDNLFDTPENQIWYRELLGLEKHKAFECVGEIDEVRLAFEICRRKGLSGKAIEMFVNEIALQDYQAITEKYTDVNINYSQIPQWIAEKVIPQMQESAELAQNFISSLLKLK